MFLQPKKLKYKKIKKGRLKKFEFKSNVLKFGTIGLKSFETGLISARQLEAARRTVVRKLNRKGKLWLTVFPDYPLTQKPNESRMGKGKGSLSSWSVKVSAGKIIFELTGVPKTLAVSALVAGSHKLSLKTKTFF